MTTLKLKDKPAKQRILEKAEELFYKQGYQATGINQIIAESGVAKASFYAHFPSKDDLCLAYLREASQRELEILAREMDQQKTPRERFLCTAELFEPWLVETEFKGCTFLNMVPEVVNPKDPIRRQAASFYTAYEKLILEAAKGLIASDKKKYGHLKAVALAKDYVTLVAGGIELAALYHSKAPMQHAIRMIHGLLD